MRARALAAVLGLGLAPLLAQAADFSVRSAAPFLNQRELHVNARLDLPFNARIEEALSKGIPIDVLFEINLVRHRWWWRNKVITDWLLRRRLQFHALSRQYLVSGLHAHDPAESFASLEQALARLGALEDLVLPLTAKKEIEPGARHLMQLRVRLDIETLPTLMRPLAYVTPSWRLNTGWTEWPLPP
jgi:hypothetical protein